MTVTEFHRAALTALAGEPNEVVLKGLAEHAQQLADMVGWANGVIDTENKVSDAFLKLQAEARAKFESNPDQNIAILHDSIGDILAAVLRHDEDLELTSADEQCSAEM